MLKPYVWLAYAESRHLRLAGCLANDGPLFMKKRGAGCPRSMKQVANNTLNVLLSP